MQAVAERKGAIADRLQSLGERNFFEASAAVKGAFLDAFEGRGEGDRFEIFAVGKGFRSDPVDGVGKNGVDRFPFVFGQDSALDDVIFWLRAVNIDDVCLNVVYDVIILNGFFHDESGTAKGADGGFLGGVYLQSPAAVGAFCVDERHFFPPESECFYLIPLYRRLTLIAILQQKF